MRYYPTLPTLHLDTKARKGTTFVLLVCSSHSRGPNNEQTHTLKWVLNCPGSWLVLYMLAWVYSSIVINMVIGWGVYVFLKFNATIFQLIIHYCTKGSIYELLSSIIYRKWGRDGPPGFKVTFDWHYKNIVRWIGTTQVEFHSSYAAPPLRRSTTVPFKVC